MAFGDSAVDDAPPPDQQPPDQQPPRTDGSDFDQPGRQMRQGEAPSFPLAQLAQAFSRPQFPMQGRPPPQWPPRWVPNRVQNYIPAMANRPWQQWGTPRTFPMQPRGWEVPGIFMGLGAQLAQYGSGMLGPMAGQLGMFSGAWMKGYMQGQEALARLRHQQMNDQADAVDRQMTNEISDYQRTFREYADPNEDPDKLDPAKQQELQHALEAVAMKYNDQHMLSALHNSGIRGAIDQLRWLDAKHGDLRAATKVNKHEQDVRDAESPYMVNPRDRSALPPQTPVESGAPAAPEPLTVSPDDEGGSGGGGDGGVGGSGVPIVPKAARDETSAAAPSEEAGAPDQVAGDQRPAASQTADEAGQPGEQAQPLPKVQLAMAGDTMSDAPQPGMERLAQLQQQRPPAQQPQPPAQQPAQRVLDPTSAALNSAQQFGFRREDIDNVAQTMLLGQFKAADYKNQDHRVAFARQRELELKQQIDRIVHDDRLKTPQEVYDRISNTVSPTLSSDVQGIVNGLTKPPLGAGIGKAPWDQIFKLVQKADPNMTAATFTTRATTWRYFTAGQGAQQLIRLGTAYDHSDATIARMKEVQDLASRGYLHGEQALESLAGGSVAGYLMPDSARRIGELEADVKTLASEYNGVMAMGGGSMTERLKNAQDLDWRNPEKAIGEITEMKRRLVERQIQLQGDFERGTSMSAEKIRAAIRELQQKSRADEAPVGKGSGPVDYREYFGGQ